jgi:porphobilinogen synthase|tara:strand:+ start:4715 stop:5701 length:987 start_codon:yes stop_codon:yes gene_type:complete
MFERKFPSTRLRRLRSSKYLRDITAECRLSKDDLIQPVFIKDINGYESVSSMPGISRVGLDVLLDEIKEIADLGIKCVAIFPVVDEEKKDEFGKESFNESNLACSAIKIIKENFPEIIIIADVALDPYTSHGHDGLVKNDYVLNDETIEVLEKQALALAKAGADILAPSDMMDGRVGAIRTALEKNNFQNIVILSYAAKFSSNFYGPFRDAVGSAANLGKESKSSYQMLTANSDEALHEVAMDINEGADIVMIKPGMPYLDVISKVKETFKIPTFAYQVSGEYSMIMQAVDNGLLEKKVMLESLLSFKRAGADAILTYAAKEISKELN